MNTNNGLDHFKLFTDPNAELLLHEDYAESLLAIDVARVEVLAGRPDAVAMTGRTALVSVGLPDRPGERIVVRHYCHGGILRALTGDRFFGKGRFLRELKLLRRAHESGVPTLDPLGLIVRRVLPGLYRADLITREVSNTVDLMKYLSGATRLDKQQITLAVARAIRTMHDAGIIHADLNLRNILVSTQANVEPMVRIIDFDKSTQLDELSMGERLWNLARFNRSLEKFDRHHKVITNTDRLRFYREYAKGNTALNKQFGSRTFDLTLHRRWWQAVEAIRGKKRHDITNSRRIVIKGANWLGDAVMSLPAIEAIISRCPNAQISLVTKSNLKPLYTDMPGIDFVIDYRDEADLLKMAPALRRWKIDAAVLFPRSFRSALMVFLARIPIRAGYRSEGRSWLLTDRFDRTDALLSTHRVNYYTRLVRGLGFKPIRNAPKIVPGAKAERTARELIAPMTGNGPLIALHPGATYGGAKQWFPERFIETGKRLAEHHDARILVLGAGKGEIELAGSMAEQIGPAALSVAGKTDLMALAALLARCDLVITNDTGPMHVAAAVGAPIVAIFGPTDPVTTAPFGEGQVVVREAVDCSPCLKRDCPIDHRCMTRLSVDRVYDAAEEQLAQGPHRPADVVRSKEVR